MVQNLTRDRATMLQPGRSGLKHVTT